MVEIATSILSVKREDAIKTFYKLETAKTDYFHIDVMDGKFVEQNTIEKMQEYTNFIKQMSNVPLDIHLMVEDIEANINAYLPYEPNLITFHLEPCKDKQKVFEFIQYIKENNIKVGIAIKPNTNIEEVYEFLPFIHVVLIMTVQPGYGGQKLIPETIDKVKQLKKYVEDKELSIDIEVDGGINIENKEKLKEAGANILVAGSSIINSNDFKEAIKNMKN